jgi:hypothetical protein
VNEADRMDDDVGGGVVLLWTMKEIRCFTRARNAFQHLLDLLCCLLIILCNMMCLYFSLYLGIISLENYI